MKKNKAKKSSAKILIKNYSAGRKVLWNRILVFCGTAIAIYQFLDMILQQNFMIDLLKDIPVYNKFVSPVLSNVLYYLGTAIVLALLKQSSFTNYSRKIKGTDVKMCVKVGNIFDYQGGIIVPSNNTFIHDTNIIGDRSIQAQIANKCETGEYKCEQSVEDQLSSQLKNNKFLSKFKINSTSIEIDNKFYDQYEYGTIVPIKVTTDKAVKSFYFLSMSRINNPKIPITNDMDLSSSIEKMWKNVNELVTESSLASPVIATGAAKFFDIPAEVIARYILKTFANYACSKNVRLNNFTLIINPNDYLEDKYDLEELHNYVHYLCKFPANETELIKDKQIHKLNQ